MIDALIVFLLLFLTWVVFSGFFGAFFIISGIISCVAAILIARRLGITKCYSCRLFYRLGSVFYLFWLIKEIVKSSIDVSIRMWQAEPNISPKFGWVPTTQKNDVGLTMFANSITLTPGTVTVVVDKDRLFVHALCGSGIDDLVQGEMDRRVKKISGGKE